MEEDKNIEFVDVKVEREEIKAFSLKSVLNGNVINRAIKTQRSFLFFLVLLASLYIANRFHAEKVVRKVTEMREEVRDLRAEQLTTASELMNLSRPSKVKELIDKKQLGLSEAMSPPFKIIVEE